MTKDISGLIESFPYIRRLRDKIIVIKFGGSIMDCTNSIESLLYDIAFLRTLGLYPVIVHGGGKAIDNKLKKENISIRKIDGFRYTSKRAIEIIREVLNEQVNTEVSFILNNFYVNAVRIRGTEVFKAKKKLLPSNEDLGFVGEIEEAKTEKIHSLLREGSVPIISPLAKGLTGENIIYNVNADNAASYLAIALSAEKIIFASDIPGVLRDIHNKDSIISSIKCSDIKQLIEEGVLAGGMLPKILSAQECIKKGVNKVHIVDGKRKHSLLLEIFTDEGIGTEILE